MNWKYICLLGCVLCLLIPEGEARQISESKIYNGDENVKISITKSGNLFHAWNSETGTSRTNAAIRSGSTALTRPFRGNDLQLKNEFGDTLNVPEKPSLTIDQPEEGTITREEEITVSGSIFPPARSTEITVNGEETDVEPLGKFSTLISLSEGSNNITVIARDRSGKVDEVTRQIILDTIPPEIIFVEPQDSSFTNREFTSIEGYVSEELSSFTIGEDGIGLGEDNVFSVNAAIEEGENHFIFEAVDLAGNSTTQTLTVTGDFEAPELTVGVALGNPDDPETEIIEVNQSDTLETSLSVVYITGEAYDKISSVEVAVNQIGMTEEAEDSVLSFRSPVELEEGLNTIEVLAYDEAGNISVVEVHIIRSRQFPFITIDSPADGFETFDASLQISGVVADTTERVLLRINDEPVPVSQDGGFDHKVYLFPGNNYFRITAVNAEDQEAFQSVLVKRNYDTTIPPEPGDVAPEVNTNVVTTIHGSTDFLYKGDNAIQRGLEEETIEPQRTGVIKGKVLDNSGVPLSGVLITILDHPEYGYTISRNNGEFDMVVNGGGHLTINYEKEDFLPVQRKVHVPWQDFAVADSVIMVQLDANVTKINFIDSIEVARGSEVTDADGSRQGTLMFEQGTSAKMVMPDGSTQTLNSLDVRATEYTVGEEGYAAMPAKLPPTSGYTYAVEFSVDEAIKAGASEVTFDKPVATYVENFIGFPVGTAVPAGYYDRQKGEWIGSQDGRVIEIIDVLNGMAEVDIDGDGVADPDSSLMELGLSPSEREKLASLYAPGESLWRVEVTHFTPWDYNWPFGPPPDAKRPELTQQERNINENDKSDCFEGSVIYAENQTLGEALNITGAPCGLHYNSAFTRGFTNRYSLPVKLSDSTIPGSAQKIRLRISVAGTTFDTTFTARPDLTYNYEWDGKDAYGRRVQGEQKAKVSISYIYQAQYYATREGFRNSFARIGTRPLSVSRGSHTIVMSQSWTTTLGNYEFTDFGGWHPGINHRYDMNNGILYKGDGTIRKAKSVNNIVRTHLTWEQLRKVGNRNYNLSDSGVNSIVPAADGSIYYAVALGFSPFGGRRYWDSQVIRKHPDGQIATVIEIPHNSNLTVAVTREDGGKEYINVPNVRIRQMDISSRGTVYFTDSSNNRVFKRNKSDEIELVAGNGDCGYSGDGGPAVSARVCWPEDIAVGDDGSVYFTEGRWTRNIVRKVGPDGIITTVAGTGNRGSNEPDGRALEVSLSQLEGIDIGPEGNVFVTESYRRVRKITPDGMLVTVAGSGKTPGSIEGWGDGGPATAAVFSRLKDVSVGPDGSLYITDYSAHVIRKVTPEGIIYRLAGRYNQGYRNNTGSAFEGESARSTLLWLPDRIAVGPSGNIYFQEHDSRNHIRDYRMIETSSDQSGDGEIDIASKDGRQIYEFDILGTHLQTRDALTGNTIFEFDYNPDGKLSKIIDVDGMETKVERNSAGTPTAFISPFGQRTELNMGPNGYLSSVQNPEGETNRFSYTKDGLLTGVTDPKGNLSTYAHDSLGYFRRADFPNGGSKVLSKTKTGDGYAVTMKTAEGSTRTNEVEQTVDGSTLYINTDTNGLQTVRQYGSDGSITMTAPDSTTTYTKQKSDPRFGMQAPLIEELKVTTPSGLTSVFSQNRTITQYTGDKITGITDEFITNGRITVSEYDGNQRRTTTTSPEGRQTFSYTDSLGRIIRSSVPGLEPVNYTYDGNGFLTETEQGGRTTAFTYNPQGFLETVTDPLGRMETKEYDSVGRVTRQILPNSEEILYDYDFNGNLVSITPPGQPAHSFEYTEVDLTDSYTPPAIPDSAGGMSYLYDKDKKLLSTLFSDSTSIQMVYDTTFAGSSRPIAINYDQGSTAFSYDSTTGNLTSVASSDSVITSYSYDGSLTTQIATQGVVNGTIDYTYNNDFQVTSQSISDANTVNFVYDDDGLLTAAGALSMSYNPQNGLLTGTTLGNFTGSYSYNTFGELIGSSHNYNSTGIFGRSYGRDSLGRITSITETIDDETIQYEYGYNEIGYLTEVRENGMVTAEYEYDVNGNLTSYVSNGDTLTAAYDDQDRMLSYGDASYFYGKRGDLQRKVVGADTTRYNYDNVGNLRSVILPDKTVIEYVIDGQDRRVAKKVNGAVTKRWLYAGGLMPVAELDSTGAVEKQYGPGYIVQNDTTYQMVRDHLGSVRMIVNSETGEVVQRIDYDEYGHITHLQNPDEFTDIGFAGGLYDMDTGFIRFGARDYDPEVGRWTAKDPILFNGGTSNLYEYALNDPINNVDINGLQVLQGSAGVGLSFGLFGVGRVEFNIGGSFDVNNPWNSKFFVSAQGSGALGVAGAGYIDAHVTGGVTREQLETGFSADPITHTEVAVGAGYVASVTTNVIFNTNNESCPIKGIGTSGFGIGLGAAGFAGTGFGGVATYTTPSIGELLNIKY